MASEAIIVCCREASPLDLHLARLTNFWGVKSRMICTGERDVLGKLLADPTGAACVMASARSLAAIFQDDAIPLDVVTRLFERIPFALVYGITPDAPETAAVRHLTEGLVASVVSFERSDHVYQVSSTEREITHEFSGLTFGPIHKEIDNGLVLAYDRPGLSKIISINNLPIFFSLKKRHSELFFLSCREIVDIESPTDGSLTATKYFSPTVPTLMFLRHVFKDQMWHNPTRRANLIVDDPLLRRSYGFLNYANLLQEMDVYNFSTTIAFIPWNYRRTSKSTAKLIKSRPDKYSICVHGCDHTEGEFSSTNADRLDAQLCLATERMKAHERSTGIPYAKVMVFPQGKFSTTALGPLKSHNYLAAVNSSSVPEDLGKAHGLTVADLLVPAVSKYSGFPLFMRRYPRRLADFAFDLFLGKPALIVEHHNYFKGGYEDVRKFMIQINSLSNRLYWMDLDEIITNTYLKRCVSHDTIECKILSNHQIIHNLEKSWKMYTLLKYEDNIIPLKSASVNGRKYPITVEDNQFRLCIEVPPNSVVEVTMDYGNTYQHVKKAESLGRNVKIYLRRHLSEVRDNYLCRHSALLSLAYRVKNWDFLGL
jgi:hypothetical protein